MSNPPLQDASNPDGRTHAALAIANLAAAESLRPAIAAATLPPLFRLLGDPTNPRGRTHAAMALGALAENKDLCKPIVAGALPSLVSLLEDASYPAGRVHAAAAVSALCGDAGMRYQVSAMAARALYCLMAAHTPRVSMLRRGGGARRKPRMPCGRCISAPELCRLIADMLLAGCFTDLL